jgi:hypothetical protein
MTGSIEDRILKWLQARQNQRRYAIKEVGYQDCMNLLHVLSERMKRMEKKMKRLAKAA